MAHRVPISQATSSRALSSRESSSDFTPLWTYNSQDTSDLGDFGELWRFLSGEKEKWCNNVGSTTLSDMESLLTPSGQPIECKQPPLLPHSSSSEYSSEEDVLVADLKAAKKKVEGYVVLTVDTGNKKVATKKNKKNKKGVNTQEPKSKGTENIKMVANTDVIRRVHFNDLCPPSNNHKPQETSSVRLNFNDLCPPSSNHKPQETASVRDGQVVIDGSIFKHNIPIPISISNDPIHVFIDNSNIIAGFHAYCGQHRRARNHQSVFGKKIKPVLEYDALFTILERGRNIARRVLVASSPLYQKLDKAENAGYEVSVLKRVKSSILDDVNNQQSDTINDNQPSSTFEMGKEQCVDELIHLKILESLLDYHAPATLVLASGDGKDAEYFQGGFHKCVIKALERGWKVEVISWKRQLSANFLDKKFLRKWKGSYYVVFLDWFAEELGCDM